MSEHASIGVDDAKLSHSLAHLQIGVYDLTSPMQKIEALAHSGGHILYNLNRNASIIERFYDAQKVAAEHRKQHTHMPAIWAGMEEMIM